MEYFSQNNEHGYGCIYLKTNHSCIRSNK